MELAFQKPNEQYVITLKEITDLVGVEHNKAMRKVEELANEEGFGGLAKTATPTFNPDVEHNKAMKKVEELALEEGFGTLAKTATVYNSKFYL